MFPLLTDQNFNGKITKGLRRRFPTWDIVRAQERGLERAIDPELLAWANGEGRVILSHDHTTMPRHVRDRLREGLPVSGVILVSSWMKIGAAIGEIGLVVECSAPFEWEDFIIRLPLS